MDAKHRLLNRLDALGDALAARGDALALLALGSVGRELDRIDVYSDLDFFVIVQPGAKAAYLDSLDWLAAPHPLAYQFRNTADGFKALYADGIFCEFAVFEPDELPAIAFSPGRVVWHAQGFDAATLEPQPRSGGKPSQEFALGEALTNLYVGMGRYRRGEKLAAFKMVQGYALDHVITLTAFTGLPETAGADPFARERRFEARYPSLADTLPTFAQGYDRTPESAQAMLAFLDAHFEVNPVLRDAIMALCEA